MTLGDAAAWAHGTRGKTRKTSGYRETLWPNHGCTPMNADDVSGRHSPPHRFVLVNHQWTRRGTNDFGGQDVAAAAAADLAGNQAAAGIPECLGFLTADTADFAAVG